MTKGIIYIVDDDRDVRLSLGMLLKSHDLETRPFAAADDFLHQLAFLRPGPVVVDVRMPEKDGMSMLSEMAASGFAWPVIVMTGHSEIPTAVKAMKLGAIEFLEKPFSDEALIAALARCFDGLASSVAAQQDRLAIEQRVGKLTERERLVLGGVVDGLSNKEMAAELGISPRTVEMHRANMMRRLRATRLPDLLAIAAAAGITPGKRPG